MLKTIQIGHRIFHFQNSIQETLAYEAQQSYYCHLTDYLVIDVLGPQAKTFLQGQLTNDILQIKPEELNKQLLCNIKGQIISKILVIEVDQQLRLIVERDLWPEVKTLLDKTARLSKVAFQENPLLNVYGLISTHVLEGSYPLNEQQSLWIGAHWPAHSHYIEKPDLFWHFISIQALEFRIYPSTTRQYLPKPLGLETQWIHFNKGCYRGQEIIARMHFLGKEKYHLLHQIMDWNEQIQPGSDDIIDLCPIDEHQALAIVMKPISPHK